MKKHLTTILLLAVFIIGLSVLLYPTVSNYVNSLHQSRAIVRYNEDLAQIDTEQYDQLLADAQAYNERLLSKGNRYILSDEEYEEYNSMLLFGSSDVIGYLEVPTIDVRLPMYHGTSEAVLQVGIGHIEGTSLPIGGESTHSGVSGHRGLPSAKLLSDLDKVVEGDRFMITVLGQLMTYEVDQILVVEPDDMGPLAIEEGQDLVTLVTCTPYGINSHRLLVRGFRVENDAEWKEHRGSGDARQIDSAMVASVIAVPPLLVLLVYVLLKYRKRKGRS